MSRPALRALQDRMRAIGVYPAHGDGVWGPANERAFDLLLKEAEAKRNIKPPLYPTLPAAYRWLLALSPLPLTIHEGLKLLGTVEVPGAGNSPIIMGWEDEVSDAIAPEKLGYTNDGIPWCGLYAAVVALRARKAIVKGPLWALNWGRFGVPVARPALGDVCTYKRPGGGHVGFFIGFDEAGYDHILGGNQADSVSIMRIASSRRQASRRPIYNSQPATVREYLVGASGKVSTDER